MASGNSTPLTVLLLTAGLMAIPAMAIVGSLLATAGVLAAGTGCLIAFATRF